jgi:hypothetical protein
MDWVANRRHGIALPYNYWPRARWYEAFDALGVRVTFWNTELGLYKPAGLLFGRGLHFIARLEMPARRVQVEGRTVARPAGAVTARSRPLASPSPSLTSRG